MGIETGATGGQHGRTSAGDHLGFVGGDDGFEGFRCYCGWGKRSEEGGRGGEGGEVRPEVREQSGHVCYAVIGSFAAVWRGEGYF